MIGLGSLRRRANDLARAALAPVPLRFWEGVFPKDAIALCYHMVSAERLPHFRLYPHKNPSQFEEDVIFARDRAVTYRELVDRRLRNTALPRNGLIFTFDDGFAECHDVVRPILQRHGVDGVFFVTTNFLDDRVPFFECTLSQCLTQAECLPLDGVRQILRAAGIDRAGFVRERERYGRAVERSSSALVTGDGSPEREMLFLWLLGFGAEDTGGIETACSLLEVDAAAYSERRPIFMSTAQIRQLAADGFTVGAHGLNHRLLENCEPEAIEREIVASCSIVRDLTGQERVPFAFPHSGLAVGRKVISEILQRNPMVDLVFDSGCLRRDPRFIVNRVFTDSPPGAERTNVPTALRDSWSTPSAWFRSA